MFAEFCGLCSVQLALTFSVFLVHTKLNNTFNTLATTQTIILIFKSIYISFVSEKIKKNHNAMNHYR